ncbi:hypothetical protein [Halobellus captivus]|uniref:hypothetical protein n=1 Tax=Halobellus captivus TaxID=2592614 RepID=UPI00119DD21A|nr:hypothetical protein [Halobellus captivus]
MSNSHDPFGSERVARARERLSDPSAVRPSIESLAVPLRFVAFWSAVALPFLYVPLLLGGLDGSEPTVFLTLFAANVVALLVGHGYQRDGRNAEHR